MRKLTEPERRLLREALFEKLIKERDTLGIIDGFGHLSNSPTSTMRKQHLENVQRLHGLVDLVEKNL